MSSLAVLEENVAIAANGSFGGLERESRFRHHKRVPLTMRFRKEKVRVMREQLAEGTYDLDEHLDIVVESLLAVLNGPKVVPADHILI